MVSLPEWNPNQWLIYQVEVHTYIGFETLEVKCTQYGICSQVAFKMGGGGQQFSVGLKKIPSGGKKIAGGEDLMFA